MPIQTLTLTFLAIETPCRLHTKKGKYGLARFCVITCLKYGVRPQKNVRHANPQVFQCTSISKWPPLLCITTRMWHSRANPSLFYSAPALYLRNDAFRQARQHSCQVAWHAGALHRKFRYGCHVLQPNFRTNLLDAWSTAKTGIICPGLIQCLLILLKTGFGQRFRRAVDRKTSGTRLYLLFRSIFGRRFSQKPALQKTRPDIRFSTESVFEKLTATPEILDYFWGNRR